MSAAKELVVKLRADASEYTKGAKQAQKDNEDVKKSTKGIGDGFLSGAKAAVGFIGTAAGIVGVGLGISSITGALTGTIGAAMDAQNTMAQTNAVLKSTHDVSGQSAKSINDFADAQMRLTGIDDQAIQGAENMIATFTNIKGNVFPGASKAVLDMATAMNGGAIPSAEQLRQTAIQVGKALNDPVQGVSALQRVGVKLSDSQLKLVKHLMATGQTAKAQGVILKELGNEFGGSAAAAGSTFAGKLAILQGQFQNVQETIGGAVLPVLSQLAGAIMPLISQFADGLPSAIKTVQGALSGLKPGDALKALGGLIQSNVLPALKQFGGFIVGTVVPAAKQLATWFLANVLPVLKTLAGIVLGTVLPALGNMARIVIGQLVPAIQRLWNFIAPQLIPVLQFVGSVLQNVVVPALTSLLSGVAGVINFIASNEGVLKTLEITLGIIGAVILASMVPAFVAWAISAGAAAIATIAATWPILAVVAVIALLVGGIIALVSHWSQVSAFFGNVAGAIGGFFGGVFGAIGSFFGNLFGAIGSFFGTLIGVIGTLAQKYFELITWPYRTAWDWIRNILGVIGAFLVTAWNTIVTNVGKALGKIGAFIGGIVQWFKDVPGQVFKAVGTFVVGLLARFGQMEVDGLKKIGEFIGGIVQWFKDLIGKVWGHVSSLASGILIRIGNLELNALQKVGSLVSGIVGFFQSLPGKAGNALANLKDMALSKINDLKATFQNGLNAVKNFFTNLVLKLPHINLPHFSITGSLSINPPSVPHLDIQWYAGGGIFTAPSIIGVGEAGPEAVVPLNRLGSMGGTGGNGTGASGGDAVFQLDGRTIVRAFMPYFVEELRRSGAIRSQ